MSRQRGFSLIEVLVAVLIFSIGLIGLAALTVMATRSNQSAYMRTQVAFLAQSMADRMSANPVGVWNGDYNATYPNTTTQTCSDTVNCTPANLANYDQQMWSNQLKTFLTNPNAKITCTNPTAYTPTGTQVDMRPPYGGNCVMSISWQERTVVTSSGTGATTPTQTFGWEFQP
jgi:type IV pilus assembly protein PilV